MNIEKFVSFNDMLDIALLEEKVSLWLKDNWQSFPKENDFLGYEINFLWMWQNNILTGNFTDKWVMQEISSFFAEMIERKLSMVKIKNKNIKENDLYQQVIDFFNKGIFTPGVFSKIETSDSTGERMHLGFENWNPFLYFRDKTKHNGSFLKAPVMVSEKKVVRNISIDFATDTLLVADWFRINEFTDLVKSENRHDINTSFGIEQQINFYKNEFNFLSIFVGNSSPHVYYDKNNFYFGYDEKVENIGQVITDLWWVTVIEKEQLINLLSKVKGEEARVIVENYIKHEDVLEVKVTPGSYQCSYCPRITPFINYAKEHNVSEDLNIDEVFFSLKKV